MVVATLAKGAASGLLWALLSWLLYRSHVGIFGAAWFLAAGAITGLVISFIVVGLRRFFTSFFRHVLLCVLLLFLAEGIFAFVLTLPVARVKLWPERWFEFTLACYWVTTFGLLGLVAVPLTFLNVRWILRESKWKPIGDT